MSCSEWRCVKLGDVGEVIGGGTPSTKNSSYYGGDISWITPKDLSGYTERYIYKGERMITNEGLEGSSAKLMPKNSILFSSRAPIGYVAIAGNELCTNQGFKSIIPNKDVTNYMFLYYLLKYKKEDIELVASGTTFLEVSGSTLKNFTVMIPPKEEQKAIAATLSCLDDKIELNNRINKNLEEMAQAIFKSWFVDFEPFQDGEFEESELGMIPKGWRVVCVDNVTLSSSTGGDAIQKTPMVEYDTGIKCVRVGDLSNQRGIDGWGYCKVDEENFNKYQLLKNDIIVTRTATLGLNQLIDEDLNAVFNNGLIRLKLNNEIIPLFFYHVINTDKYLEYIGCIESESSTRPNMKMNYLLKYKFVCPPLNVQNAFLNTVQELRTLRLKLQKQIKVITEIRDTLLPKLMSGEIRVPIEEVQ